MSHGHMNKSKIGKQSVVCSKSCEAACAVYGLKVLRMKHAFNLVILWTWLRIVIFGPIKVRVFRLSVATIRWYREKKHDIDNFQFLELLF